MKKLLVVLVFATVTFSASANAFWGGNNNWGNNNGWDDNDWPVWTPMYWMEEMSNEFDNNDMFGNNNNNYYRNGYGYNNGYNNGYAPNGYGMPMPAYPQYAPAYPQYAPAYPATPAPATK